MASDWLIANLGTVRVRELYIQYLIFYLKILFSLFPFIAAFSKFSALKELELPLNNIHNTIKIQPDVFRNLETLDLSYNRLTDEDILTLGLLANLRTLHLTGIRASLNIKMYCIL